MATVAVKGLIFTFAIAKSLGLSVYNRYDTQYLKNV